MARYKYLHPLAKAKINTVMDDVGEIPFDEAVEIVMPHIEYDFEDMKLQLAKRVTRSLLAARKDAAGVRKCYSTKWHDKKSVYVDIDTCKDLNKVRAVENQLEEKHKGAAKAHKKARKRRRELEGQISMTQIGL